MADAKSWKRNPRFIRVNMWFQSNVWRIQQSGRFVVFVVYFSLFLDNMLLTMVVPIIPDLLYNWECQKTNVCPCRNRSRVKDKSLRFTNGPSTDSACPLLISSNGTENQSSKNWIDLYSRDPMLERIEAENSEIGILFASKALVQLLSNPIVGSLTNRFGYTTPLFFGSTVLLVSSLVYTFGHNYASLFAARSIQGLGSSCVFIAGMAMVADRYPEDKERSKIMGLTLGGTALGVLIGYPFGGIVYYFTGKTAPLAIVAGLLSLNVLLQLIFLRPRLDPERLLIGTSIIKLLADPYIVLTAGAICVSTSTIAALEPSLPIWLMKVINPPKWQLGTVFIPDSLGYLLGTNMFGAIAFKIGRWLAASLSLLLVGICSIMIPLSTEMVELLIPHFGLGLGIGITDAALIPLLAYFVDTRYVAMYGSVYAIAQVAVSTAYSLGPLFGGEIVKRIGFPWLMRSLGIINLMVFPLCYFLRNPKPIEDDKVINFKTSLVSNVPETRCQIRGPLYSSFIDKD